jgi:hypothetical protein
MSLTKSQRKFRFWDNKTLFQNLERTLQFKEKIEELALEQEKNVTELPDSVVPTYVLYELVLCYEAMYDKLIEEELLTHGYPKSTTNQH